jgi:hypothetical protein
MTATSTPEPVAELVARITEVRGRYAAMFAAGAVSAEVDDVVGEMLEVATELLASTIATLTAERDAATARIAELEAERDYAVAKQAEAIADAKRHRDQSEARRKTICGYMNDPVYERLATATALASKARGAALEEAAKVADDEYDQADGKEGWSMALHIAGRLRDLSASGEAE